MTLSSLVDAPSVSLLFKRSRPRAYREISSRNRPTRKGIKPGPGARNSPKPMLREKKRIKRLKRIQKKTGIRDLCIYRPSSGEAPGGNPAVQISQGA
jgi:predicted DNA-binding transcriptional regulator AlpA